MPRLNTVRNQYLDSKGDPYSGGLLYLYESGTSNLITSYSDEAETTPNTNPVVLDADGRIPDIWFNDVVKMTLKTSTGVTVFEADPVNCVDAATPAFALYDSGTTYNLYDKVRGSNAKYYHSINATNLNNDPISSPTKWTEVRFIEIWNTNVTYALGDTVLDSSGILWRSLIGSNSGTTPGTDDSKWIPAITVSWVNKTASFTMAAGSKYNITASSAVDAALPAIIATGDQFIAHNASTSSATVRITNTFTIKGSGGTLTTGNHIILKPGDTADLVAVSSSELEVV